VRHLSDNVKRDDRDNLLILSIDAISLSGLSPVMGTWYKARGFILIDRFLRLMPAHRSRHGHPIFYSQELPRRLRQGRKGNNGRSPAIS